MKLSQFLWAILVGITCALVISDPPTLFYQGLTLGIEWNFDKVELLPKFGLVVAGIAVTLLGALRAAESSSFWMMTGLVCFMLLGVQSILDKDGVAIGFSGWLQQPLLNTLSLGAASVSTVGCAFLLYRLTRLLGKNSVANAPINESMETIPFL